MAYTYITVGEINQYLNDTKFEIGVGDAEELILEASESAYVMGRLSTEYDVLEWTNASTTPVLVRSVIAMRVAGRLYLSQLADYDQSADQYGRMLLRDSMSMIGMILSADVNIDLNNPTIARSSETYEFVDPLFTVGARF